jgi:hypothetical protein
MKPEKFIWERSDATFLNDNNITVGYRIKQGVRVACSLINCPHFFTGSNN